MVFDELKNLLSKTKGPQSHVEISKPQILIIDDDKNVLQDIVFALSDKYQVLAFDNGIDGIEVITSKTSAVVLDIHMPEQDGFWTFKEIKKKNLHLPIIFHSAFQNLKDPYVIMNEYRPFGYVDKGADPKQLRDSIASAVEYYSQILNNNRLVTELNHTKQFLDNILNSMSSILIGVDNEKKVIYWNLEAEKATEILSEKAIGSFLVDLLPWFEKEIIHVELALSKQEIQRSSQVKKIINKKLIYIDIIVYPLSYSNFLGAVIRIDNVTTRVQMDQIIIQTEKMTSIGEMAAGFAHEINNPLGAIIQAVQNIQRRLSPDLKTNYASAEECGLDLNSLARYMDQREITKFIENIKESGLRASHIIKNLLYYSRKSESNINIENLHNIIDQSIELAKNDFDLNKQYDFRHVKITKKYTKDLPLVLVSKTQMVQVFLNLLINASQAMVHLKDSAHISIQTKKLDNTVCVEIEDNGPGMDDSIKKYIFDPFFTTKEPGVGTGLGLFVSYMIIKNNHNGSIDIKSFPGKGTKFIIQLPIQT